VQLPRGKEEEEGEKKKKKKRKNKKLNKGYLQGHDS